MYKKIVVYCILCIFFYHPLTANAQDQVNDPTPESANSRLFFLFKSDGKIEADTSQPVIAFFSTVTIEGNTGNVYAFFSTIHHGRKNKTYNLSSTITYDKSLNGDLNHESLLSVFSQMTTEQGVTMFNDKIPTWILYLFNMLINIFISMSFFALKPSLMEQGSMVLVREPEKVLQNGISAYFLGVVLALIFGIGVILLPLTIIIFLVLYMLSMIGEAALAVLLGYQLAFRQGKEANTATYAFIGIVFIEMVKKLPIVGWVIGWILLPILTIGISITTGINGWLKKKFYEIPYRPTKKTSPRYERHDII